MWHPICNVIKLNGDRDINEYQEAWNNVFEMADVRVCKDDMKLFEAAADTLQKLVDRATPKKVKVVPGDRLKYDAFCPNCNQALFDGSDTFFLKKRYQFCDYCGQALDWNNNEI